MADDSQSPNPPESGASYFATTHWSVVLAAGDTSSPQAGQALERLCSTYWYPLYAYVRRQGHSPEDAQDLTQEFFARFLQRKYFRLADRQRGRFRGFLLTSMKHFLINEWGRASAQKRGGGKAHIPLDTVVAENLYRRDPAQHSTPDKIYELNYALAVLQQVRRRLEQEYAAAGKAEYFAQLEQFLPGQKGELTYAEAAQVLGVAEGTIKSDVHRLKQRYRELLRAEIADTVSTYAEINEELRHLMSVLSG